MTQLDERNGWHVVAEGVPDTTRDVWAVTRIDFGISRDEEPMLRVAYHNKGGWWWSKYQERARYPVLLWHEIECPEIPQALRESMEVVER